MKEIAKLFRYEPITGELFWVTPRGNALKRQRQGFAAGSLNNKGYVCVKVNWKTYKVHRIVFFMCHGYLSEFIDHINGCPSDNRIENLREATRAQNGANMRVRGGSSRFKGVTWHKPTKKWRAYTRVHGKRTSLGYFTSELEAAKAYNEAAVRYFGEFAKLNKIG